MTLSPHSNEYNFYPLDTGNRWVYSREGDDVRPGEDLMTITVVNVEQEEYGRIASLWMQISADRFEPQVIRETEHGLFDGEWCFLKFPIHNGDQWDHNGFAYEVLRSEQQLTLASHAFSECVVVRRVYCGRTVDTTYAKGVGPVLFSEFGSQGQMPFTSVSTISQWKVS